MALTVEELQIVLSCDATTAQAVLEKMDATVKAYTQKFQKYFNTMGGKGGGSKAGSGLDNVGKNATNAAKRVKDLSDSLRDMQRNEYKVGKVLSTSDISSKINENIQKGWANKDMYKNAAKEVEQIYQQMSKKKPSKDYLKQVRAGNINAENNPQWGKQGEGRMLAPSFAETFKATLASLPDLVNNFVMKSTDALSKVGSVLGKTFAIGAKVAIGAVRTLGTVVETVARTIGTVLKSAISGLIGTVQKVGGAIKKAFSHTLLGKFLKRLGSVMMRMAAMKLIRGTIDGIKKGLEELAKTSASSAKAMNTIKAAGGSIKMALGAAVMPIVKALAPVFVQLAGAISAAANALARFFAVVTGQSTYTAVNFSGALDDVSESAGGAGKAVKGMLADFDELHVLQKNSGGGGGGSSGVEQSLSTVADVDAVSELGTKLRRAIQSGDWEGIGETLTDLVAGWVAKFDGFIDKVRELNLGKKLAELMNGVFSDQEKWASIGSTFGKGLGVLTTELINFFKNFDFEEFFRSVGAFFSGFAASFFEQLKDVFPEDSWADNLLEGLYAAFGSMTKLFTDNNEWKLAVTNWKATWNGLKISALETWRSILEALDGTKIGDLFGVPEALERNAGKLAEAKEAAEQYELEMRVLNKTIADQKTKTEEATEAQEEYAKGSYSWSGYGQQFRETQEQATASVKAFTEKVTAANTPLGAMTKYMADLVKQKITELIVKATIGGPIDPTEVIEGGKNTGVYSTNTGIALALGVVPQLGDRSKLTGDMNKYVVRSDNPWQAPVNPVYNTGKDFFDKIKEKITGKIWQAPVNSVYHTGKDFFDKIKEKITGVTWKAWVNPMYNTGKNFFDNLKERITGVTWKAWVNPMYNTGKSFFDKLKENITGKTFSAKVDPKYNTDKAFFDSIKTNITGKTFTAKVDPKLNNLSTFNDSVKTATKERSMTVKPKYEIPQTFKDTTYSIIEAKDKKITPKANITTTYAEAIAKATEDRKLKVTATLSGGDKLKEAIQETLSGFTVKVTYKDPTGSKKAAGKLLYDSTMMASGGIAYGLTHAIIGEYAGARNNPEVVAPLNKLQGILERSGSTGSKDTMTKDQANTMIRLLQQIEKKELAVKPSLSLAEVVRQSNNALSRT